MSARDNLITTLVMRHVSEDNAEELYRAVCAEILHAEADKVDSAGHHWSGMPAHALFEHAEEMRARATLMEVGQEKV